jgi:hypothetical protein
MLRVVSTFASLSGRWESSGDGAGTFVRFFVAMASSKTCNPRMQIDLGSDHSFDQLLI